MRVILHTTQHTQRSPKYIKDARTTFQTWQALKEIYESPSQVNLVTLQTKLTKLEWNENLGLDTFADKFQEFMRQLEAAGDQTPQSAYIDRFLCLLPQRFSGTVMHIVRDRTNKATKYTSMPPIIAELKLDDERQQLHNPSLAKKSTDDAFNVGVNECRYCGKQGHYSADCYKKQSDRDKGIFRSNVSNTPKQTNGRGRGNSYRGNGRGRDRGRGRGGNFGRGRGGYHQRQVDDGNAAFNDVDDLFYAT